MAKLLVWSVEKLHANLKTLETLIIKTDRGFQ